MELQITQAVAKKRVEPAIRTILGLLVKEEDLARYTWTGRKRSIDKESLAFTGDTEKYHLLSGKSILLLYKSN